MDLDKIKQRIGKDYRKHASRDLCVFASSIFGEVYVKTLKELFGLQFPSIFWVVRKGNFMTFYRSEKDHQKFRKQIGEMARDKVFSAFMADKLKEYTDWFSKYLKNRSLVDAKEEFIDNYRIFFAYHVAVYWAGDYLAEHYPNLSDIIDALQEAYAYNENVIPDVERYLAKQGVAHLTYKEVAGKFREVGIFFFIDMDDINLYGKDLDEIESYVISLSRIDKDIKELKGLPVSQGKVQGKVQVIRDPNDLHMAEEGNIIVCGMTRPQFNHVLKNSLGIIADEGNILSHAAILARESQIPVVVRTGNATEVLKDGDMVELDATEGIVRLLD